MRLDETLAGIHNYIITYQNGDLSQLNQYHHELLPQDFKDLRSMISGKAPEGSSVVFFNPDTNPMIERVNFQFKGIELALLLRYQGMVINIGGKTRVRFSYEDRRESPYLSEPLFSADSDGSVDCALFFRQKRRILWDRYSTRTDDQGSDICKVESNHGTLAGSTSMGQGSFYRNIGEYGELAVVFNQLETGRFAYLDTALMNLEELDSEVKDEFATRRIQAFLLHVLEKTETTDE